MAYKITEQMINEGKVMLRDGFTYYDISEYYKHVYDISMHPESIRYHITRKDKPKVSVQDKLIEQGIEKVLVLSDLHIPFHRDDILDIVMKHKDEINMIVFNGDVIDCKAISKYIELGRGSLNDEMAICHELLKTINNITPTIRKVITTGNHEKRLAKYMAQNPNELNGLHTSNILQEVVDGFKTVNHDKGQVVYFESLENYEVIDNWYYQYEGVIYCHPLSFSKIPARTAYNAVEYFVRNGFDFNTCIVAHTHHYGACKNLGKYTVETGCLCQPMPYSQVGKLNYIPQDYGYHLVVLKDGKYNINESRNYIL